MTFTRRNGLCFHVNLQKKKPGKCETCLCLVSTGRCDGQFGQVKLQRRLVTILDGRADTWSVFGFEGCRKIDDTGANKRSR